MDEQDMKVTVINDDGEEMECVILLQFERGDKEYVVYTDGSLSEEGNTNVFAAIMGEEDALLPIETDEEWDMIQELLDQLAEQLEDSEN